MQHTLSPKEEVSFHHLAKISVSSSIIQFRWSHPSPRLQCTSLIQIQRSHYWLKSACDFLNSCFQLADLIWITYQFFQIISVEFSLNYTELAMLAPKVYMGKSKKNKPKKVSPLGIKPGTSWSWPQSSDWAKSLFGCQSECLRLLQNHALLILEMTKVQNVKWCVKLSSLQKSPQYIPATTASRTFEWRSRGVGSMTTGSNFLAEFILLFPM